MEEEFEELVMFILNAAVEEAQQFHHKYLTPEHVLYAALQFHPVQSVLELLKVDVLTLEDDVCKYLSLIQDKSTHAALPSPGFGMLLKFAYNHTKKTGESAIGVGSLLKALVQIEEAQETRFLKKRSVTQEKISEVFEKNKKSFDEYLHLRHREEMDSTLGTSFDDSEYFHNDEDYFDESSRQDVPDDVIKKFTVDLTAKAKRYTTQSVLDTPKDKTKNQTVEKTAEEGFEPFLGQEKTIENLLEVLLRRKKNNVLLVGDPGVGKTALVREIAYRITQNNVPTELQNFSLLEVNLTTLIAGTRYRGDFEERVKQFIDAISTKKCIIFIDEIHTILGVGVSSTNSNDFADLIKPLLVEGNIRFIGATTYEEYKKIEKEKTLLRRFSTVDVPEPDKSLVMKILQTIVPRYEKYYTLKYTLESLETLIYLCDNFIRERKFPDKAIDVLDSLGAMFRVKSFIDLSQNKNTRPVRTITPAHVELCIKKITKQPLTTTISKNEFAQLTTIENKLNKIIFGQQEAIVTLVKTVRRSKTGLVSAEKPLASMLFVGNTGVGKTELSKQFAKEMAMKFLRFDMSEYQEKHSVSKFIGAPPGYIGHEDGGVLIDKVRRNPYSVVLLDEIEKAHSDVFNLLLQVMDYGIITDSSGVQADFRNVVLIMTSNAGVKEAMLKGIGFKHEHQHGRVEIKQALTKIFSPEFRNRLDEVIIFNPLHVTNIRSIIRAQLNSIKQKLLEKNIELFWSSSVISFLLKKGFSPMFGARNIIRTIDKDVRDCIAEVVVKILSDKNYQKPIKNILKDTQIQSINNILKNQNKIHSSIPKTQHIQLVVNQNRIQAQVLHSHEQKNVLV